MNSFKTPSKLTISWTLSVGASETSGHATTASNMLKSSQAIQPDETIFMNEGPTLT